MVGLTSLGCVLFLIPFASAGMTTALLRAVSRSNSLETLRSMRDLSSQTLQTLDVNQDGTIDPSEVEQFARDEGLDEDSVTDDFSGLDTNGDGVLDSAELLQVLGGGGAGNKTISKNATLPSPPVVAKGLATEKPITKVTAEREAHISIQEKHPPVQILGAKQEEARAPEMPQKQQQSPRVPRVEVPTITDPVKPTPVERMVKHFAQVLRTADIIPVREDTLRLARAADTAAMVADAAADETRSTVQSAAKEVAEQLSIVESAQEQARVLDRKAAEERANATILAKLTTQQALDAGAAAAHSKSKELLARIGKLEDEAERTQVRSAALHSKAALETEEAKELMSVADRAMHGY